jgi:hypothetical protein
VGKRVPCHVRHFIFKKNCLQSLRDRDRAAQGPPPPSKLDHSNSYMA